MNTSGLNPVHGIRANWPQFLQHLAQVFFVGATVGMTRTVLPVLAQTDFGLAANSFLALSTFVIVFGLVKSVLNLVAGDLSDRLGRKRVLLLGWMAAIPIPFLILFGQSWGWIILATGFLGINQGLAWSMALNSKLDLTRAEQRGLVNGLNEFAGYGGVALAGVLAAFLAHWIGARMGLFWFSLAVISVALTLGLWAVRETRPWALAQRSQAPETAKKSKPRTLRAIFWQASIKHPGLLALNQAGLVEKFTDSIVWLFFPIFFLARGMSLAAAGSLIAIYGVTWGAGQLITGPLSDKIGRKILIVGGMWLCGVGVLAVSFTDSLVLWSIELALIGLGMAMLYPTLGAAVADLSLPAERASVLGVYRFWRDFGYAVGGLLLGLAAQMSGHLALPFWLVAIAMFLSGGYVWLKFSPQPALTAN
ncbi:MAG: MFS transporter [Halothiobacillus sp. 24-54-40]|jgi:MFS family permease|nr:MAG: MFS transporter [Halothiobacillus sp. 35-54-62]OYZ87259.1 MAG: MFS transporter [Halothiobacillus sp. 24-54-40]OZA80825.1 MAG: MFS transporter [Halothiobacillus sp. 39-53-45]HQS03258.1 MFS transporter [Halothiobacillus sp.]HQS29605.1 MFS transporter [Halothiobacillus sp.]